MAADCFGGIGLKGGLPWSIKEDLEFFKEKTRGSVVCMGRKTWESLPRKPLPSRKNIVISRTISDDRAFAVCKTIDEALPHMPRGAFVIGGVAIYREFLHRDLVDKLFLTRVYGEFETDSVLSEFSTDEMYESFKPVSRTAGKEVFDRKTGKIVEISMEVWSK